MGTCCKSLPSDAPGHSEGKRGALREQKHFNNCLVAEEEIRPCFKVSSGPYKYHKKVFLDSEKKGFNSQSKRFQCNRNETPGPGFYNVAHQSAESNSISLSQKGTGYFPSLVARIAGSNTANYPAANAYRIPSCFQSKQDFSTGNSSMFQQPIARKAEKIPTPAPGQYDTSRYFCKRSNNVSAHAVFVSKTPRGLNLEKQEKWPSPCHYNISDSSTKVSPKSITSCFKSKTSHQTNTDRFIAEYATYQPRKTIKKVKKTPSRQKFCLTLSAPAIPPCKEPPLPGPGHYDLVDYKGSRKQNRPSAVFASSTRRWTGGASLDTYPGPGAYSPRVLERDSFIYNYDSKWLPVM